MVRPWPHLPYRLCLELHDKINASTYAAFPLQLLEAVNFTSSRQCSGQVSYSPHQLDLLRDTMCTNDLPLNSAADLVALLTSSLKQTVEFLEQAYMDFTPSMWREPCPYVSTNLELVFACNASLHRQWARHAAFSYNVSFDAVGVILGASLENNKVQILLYGLDVKTV